MTLSDVINEIRLLQQPLRRKLAVNRHNGDNLVWCCVCDNGISYEDNKPVYYTVDQKEEVKEQFESKLSHGYCSLCMSNEMYKTPLQEAPTTLCMSL